MEILRTISEVRNVVSGAKREGKRIGFVPTMGALHEGHMSLVEEAKKRSGLVIVSIFVNPTQFGPGEDLDKYPRTLDSDLEKCRLEGVDVVFAPAADEMYPEKNLTWVKVDKITEGLCGDSRPGHFRGVCTVCTKLFNIVQPDAACFGQKDAQQAAVIKRMVRDLNMPLEIVVCPTVREADGLAVSSRNAYLSRQHRLDASLLYKSLKAAETLITQGEKDVDKVVCKIRNVLSEKNSIEVEYINVVDLKTLEPVERIKGENLVAVAVKIDSTRLIDNIVVDGR